MSVNCWRFLEGFNQMLIVEGSLSLNEANGVFTERGWLNIEQPAIAELSL